MSLTLQAARQAIATRLDLISGWKESPHPYERFAESTNLDLSACFAVGIPDFTAREDRQIPAQGVLGEADVRIAFAQKMRPKQKIGAYDDGLSAGLALVTQLLAVAAPWPGEQHVRLVGISGGVNATGEWFLGEVRMISLFRLTTT